MEKISQDFYDILTQVTFKVKTRFHVFFFFKHKSKNTQRVWGKNRQATKISFTENITKRFFTHIDFVDAELFLITPGSTRCKKLMYRFRFYFACCNKFTMIFRIVRWYDASIILIEIKVYLFRTGQSILFYYSRVQQIIFHSSTISYAEFQNNVPEILNNFCF